MATVDQAPTPPGQTHEGLQVFALGTFLFTSLLLFSGGYTTTIGAGMIFPDWPLSNGSLNPEGWLTNRDMAAEHSHRLFGAVVGILTLILAFWTWRVEPRRWVKRAATVMLALVVIQGLLGGLRVRLVSTDLAMIHGCVAQIYLCALATMVFAQIPGWRRSAAPEAGKSAQKSEVKVQSASSNSVGWLSPLLTILIFAQLLIAAAMRHQGAGLAIPTFPLTPEGTLIPTSWPGPIAIHFAHRAMALVITLVAIGWAWSFIKAKPWSQTPAAPQPSHPANPLGWTFLGLLVAQILLGALTIWTTRNPVIATLHVIIGAYLLASSWGLTLAFGSLPNFVLNAQLFRLFQPRFLTPSKTLAPR